MKTNARSRFFFLQMPLNSYYIFLFWILLTVGTVIGAPEDETFEVKLMPSISEVVHFENDSYIVSCQALIGDGKRTRLRWFDSDDQWVENDRGRIHVEERENELVLVFTSISLEDNGNWTCEAEKDNKKIAFNMIVYKPITFVDEQVIQSVKENDDAIIKCMVLGDPEPSVSWYYNGQPINLDEKKYKKLADGLLIKQVQKNDSGEYSCKAFQISSALSNVKERTIRLNIQHKPISPVRRESANIQYGYLKGFVNVTCEAEAEPPATFMWYRGEKHLNPKHYQIINSQHISILQLYLNDSNQFGDYVCEAQNSLGTLRRTIELISGTKPNAPPHITLRGVNSNTFDLDVGAKKSTTPSPMDIIGYRFEILSTEEHRNNGGKWTNARVVLKDFTDGVTYLINNLSPNTTYWIRVASRNPAGLSDWMGPKEFRTHAKAAFGTSAAAPSTAATLFACHNLAIHLILYLTYDIFLVKGWNYNF